jgi:cysteine-rich repeat protein
MMTLRSIYPVLVLSVLSVLSACATRPDSTKWRSCDDGTFCPAGTTCSSDNTCMPLEGCGDDGVGCPPTKPFCGDCSITGDEECDDGNQNDGDGCDSNCRRTPGMLVDGEGTSCPGKGRTPSAPL